jgi:hypothetical protein
VRNVRRVQQQIARAEHHVDKLFVRALPANREPAFVDKEDFFDLVRVDRRVPFGVQIDQAACEAARGESRRVAGFG